jgi:phosphohistidine phosphatase
VTVFLIRHAKAEDASPDTVRRLSREGRSRARDLGKFLGRSDAFAPAAVWHSTLVRARETAELVAAGLPITAPLEEVDGLAPEDDPRAFASRLRSAPDPLAIVGHEPFLGAFASLLVTGAPDPVCFHVRKGAVIALEGAGRRWVVRWHLSPELLP